MEKNCFNCNLREKNLCPIFHHIIERPKKEGQSCYQFGEKPSDISFLPFEQLQMAGYYV